MASSTNDVARELGGAIGIALIGSALTSGYRRSIDGTTAIPAELAPLIRDSAPAGLTVADKSPDPFTIIEAVRNSVVDGFSQSMILAGGLLTIATLYVALRTPPRSQEQPTGTAIRPEHSPEPAHSL